MDNASGSGSLLVPASGPGMVASRRSISTRWAASARQRRICSSRCAPRLERAPSPRPRRLGAVLLHRSLRGCACAPRVHAIPLQWGLGCLDLIYAHQGTTIFRLVNSAPPTRASYFASGWTGYESAAASILKLQHASVWQGVIDVGELTSEVATWKDVDGRVRKVGMPPSMSIAAFREKVRTLHFTNGSDQGLVAALYETMITAALGGAELLRFASAGWSDAEAASFAESLALCTRLNVLYLGHNAFGSAGLAAVARPLGEGAAPQLQRLYLDRNDFSDGDEGVRVLGRAQMPALKVLWMNDTRFRLSALVEGMHQDAWPSLKELRMNNNKEAFSDEGAEALARALERGAMPKLKTVWARGCSAAGSAAIKKARPGVQVMSR